MTDDHIHNPARADAITAIGSAREQADAWVVRISGDDAGEADWLAFEAWLCAAPGNRELYDEAMALWLEFDERSEEITVALDRPSVDLARAAPFRHRRARLTYPMAMAAGLALLGGVIALALLQSDPSPIVYQTAKGQTRSIRLQDGSTITLNSGSRIQVVMGRRSRRVTMGDAEASFDVAKDPGRPFLIAAGDQQVRVVGTEFNILNHRGQVAVTVRRGVVEVRPAADVRGPAAARLKPGAELVHLAGASGYQVRQVDPAVAFAWKSGYLVFEQRPLGEVADQLNRYFKVPVEVDPRAAKLKFTGVLQIDREDRMLARLQAFLPVTMVRGERGYRLSLRS